MSGTPGRKCASKRNLPPKPCKICGQTFVPQRAWQNFCSAECREKHHARPWGNARQKANETYEEFRNRINGYRRKIMANYVEGHKESKTCSACTRPVVHGIKSWCEYHWFQQAAWRNHFRSKGDGEKSKALLEKQNYECAYTGKKLVLGVNASLDHKNPRSRFPDQRHLWENVEWVDIDVNRAKRSLTKEEFLDLCRLVAHRHPKTPDQVS